MTVSSSANRADYNGNGVTTAFTVPFYFPDPTNLKVLSTVVATGVSTPLVLNSDYTVSGAGVSTGGTVTTTVAPAAGVQITILLSLAFVQGAHYVPNDPFPAASHEAALDYLTLLDKQTEEQVSRAIQVPQGESGTNVVLPPAVSRAGFLLGFDGSGAIALIASVAQSATALATSLLSSVGSTLISFLQAGVGAVLRTLQSKLQDTVSVTDFGAKGDGVTDDKAAIQKALNSGASAVFFPTPSVAYYCSAGLTQPAGVVIYGFGFAMDSTPSTPRGTSLLFATSTPNCLTTVNGGNRSAMISGINIVRKTGTPPALSNAILNSGSYGVVIEKVLAANHAIGLTNKGDGASAGIAMFADTFVTAGITDSHLVIDSFPESRFVNCRFGSNGTLDAACNSFIRIQGGSTTNPASGPNTLVMTSCQFNQGANNAASWIAFNNQLPGSIADATDWQFSNCYIETASAGISSDGTWGAIGRLFMDNVNFNIASPFLDASLSVVDLNDWQISNCKFAGSFAYPSTTNHLNTVKVSNCTITGFTNINGAGSSISKIVFSNNSYDGSIQVSGSFVPFSSIGGSINGTVSLTATGINYYFTNYTTGQTTWTPVLNINGSPTGITGTFQGEYTLNGRILTCTYRIILTAIGASTGQVTITGMPFAAAAGTLDHNGGSVIYAQNLVGLTGQLTARMSTSTTALLSQSAATGTSAITQANLSATTILYGSISYPI